LRIAILGDWGTGTKLCQEVLKSIASHKPQVLIHLGDVYYSGTQKEQENSFYKVISTVLPKDVAVYSIPGNHDYYSGGKGFFEVLNQFGQNQTASFFCLSNKHWQIQGMDTGFHDVNPVKTALGSSMTHVREEELLWQKKHIREALDAKKRIILLSHHQVFSAYSTVGEYEKKNLALNIELWAQFEDLIDHVTIWYWGHEHFYTIYGPYRFGEAILQRGRLVGHGAVPMPTDDEQYKKQKYADTHRYPVPNEVPGAEMHSKFGYFFNGYAILTLSGNRGKCDYYEVPITSEDLKSGSIEWGAARITYSETF